MSWAAPGYLGRVLGGFRAVLGSSWAAPRLGYSWAAGGTAGGAAGGVLEELLEELLEKLLEKLLKKCSQTSPNLSYHPKILPIILRYSQIS